MLNKEVTNKIWLVFFICFGTLFLVSKDAAAQGFRQGQSFPGLRGSGQSQGKSSKDSLQSRNSLADSITIYYRYFDSSRNRNLDSSLNDFTKKFPLPYYYHHLGNYGTAAQSLLFNPFMKSGFDAGFHQYDIYRFTVENTKFYQTTRPFTELGYMLGSKAEQLIDLKHTQNRKGNFNYSLEYRFSNSPGGLKNQNASHNNFRFTTHYLAKNRKYEIFFIYLSNKTASSENGGLVNTKQLDSLALNDPFELETRMGRTGAAFRNPFNTRVTTGILQKENTLLIRHHYDFGQKDSVVKDTTTFQIFYPRFRIEHTLKFSQMLYQFNDNNVDSTKYLNFFNYQVIGNGIPFQFKDSWRSIQNEFSMVTFPDKNNQRQFIKAGIGHQSLQGIFDTLATTSLYNIYTQGEYRNRTRNQVWDIEANGKLYLNGFNAGDYEAYISMKRLLGKKIGLLNIGLHNINRSPSFILNSMSSFPVSNRSTYGKENIIKIFAVYENPKQAFQLSGSYYAVSNYMYFDSFFTAKQATKLFNVLHIALEKKIKLFKHWNWYTEVHLQQTTGNPPVNIPLILTRNRIAFEGNFYTNLFISTGLELRYHTAYKADNYSPLLGQYFYQNSNTLSNRPDINAFLHFRIKSFKCFVRVENLNAANLGSGGFGFTKPNLNSADYPNPTLWTRVGIWWNFVN